MGRRAVVVAAACAAAALSIVGNAAAAGITIGPDGETAPVFCFVVEVAGPTQQLAALHTAKAKAVLRQLRAGHHRAACTLARRGKLTNIVRVLGC